MNPKDLKKLAELLAELDQWRQQAKDADAVAKKLQVTAVTAMKKMKEEDDTGTIVFDSMGRSRRATLIEPTKTIIDEEGLLDSLTPAQRKLITRTVIDQSALSDAIDRGKINAREISKHITTEDGTPSIRIGAGS